MDTQLHLSPFSAPINTNIYIGMPGRCWLLAIIIFLLRRVHDMIVSSRRGKSKHRDNTSPANKRQCAAIISERTLL